MKRPDLTRRTSIDPEVAQLLGRMRKVRSDATGQQRDYHKATRTLTLRLGDDIVTWVRSQAAERGMSVNAWLGALVMAEWGRRRTE